ncbi:hypothetical protein CO641_08975 [Lysobacteraceae bacterium NML91-0213]|nr:hypothetical protein CO641_08975 [Xanthomonadaceae bacterium NML91-0213]
MADSNRRHHPSTASDAPVHMAAVRARVGPAALRARVRITTCGLMAGTALVTSTLLSAAAIVAVSTRKLPPGTLPAGMRRSRW